MIRPGTSSARLVAHLLQHGPRHRAELARALSISRGTTTTIVQQLLEGGVLVDGVLGGGTPLGAAAGAAPGPLRLKQKLGISRRRGVFAHVVFKATASVLALTALDGRVLAHDVHERPRLALASEWLEEARPRFDALLARLDLSPDSVVHLHASLNSQVDRLTGEILDAEVAGPWKGTQPREQLAAWAPRAGISFENTARLMALAESLLLGRREGALLRLDLSWGIGMGHVFDGRIVTGSHGASGELGHVSIDAAGPPCDCGRRGCLWLYAGAGRVIDRTRAALGPAAGLPDIARAAAAGDGTCRRAVSEAGEAVGEALATVCNLLGPDVVAVGGELAVIGQPLLDTIRRRLLEAALPLTARHVSLVLSRIGEDPVPVIDASHSSLLNDESVLETALQRASGLPDVGALA